MKKITLAFIIFLATVGVGYSQPNLVVQAPAGPTTTQLRAPNGTSGHAYLRACSLVLASELTNLPSGSNVSLFGFTLSAGTGGAPVAGNFTVYLQNTTDVTYQKGVTWSSIITGMQTGYASTMAIPGGAGATAVTVTLSTPFNYTGGGIYVAYDWNSPGPYASGAVGFIATYYAEGTALAVGGCSSASGITSPATTLGTTAFRPSFLFTVVNPNANDMQVIGLEAPGKVAAVLNQSHNILGIVKNSSNGPLTNIPVTLNVSGANTFVNTQTISSLAAGAITTVTFAAFNPQNIGLNTVSVSVPADDVLTNNLATYAQSVTCSTWAQNPAGTSYTSGAVGFNTGAGILATTYSNVAATTLTGLRSAISNNAASVGNSSYGVLLSAAGVVLATTNTFVITNAMLSTFQDVTFATPQALSAGTQYYIGFAQVANLITGYYPAGTFASNYVNANLYYSTGITGGVYTPLGSGFGYFGLEAVLASTVTITASTPTVACGSSATLAPTSNVTTYSWSTGATTASIVVTPTINAAYTLTATSSSGCIATKAVSVAVTPLALTVTSPTVICGSPATLSAVSAGNYSWSSGATTASITIASPTLSTTYTVTTNNVSGCVTTKISTLTVNPLAVVASISSNTVCPGLPVTLSVTGAPSYVWGTITGSLNTAASFTDIPLQNTTYTVIGSNSSGCQSQSAVNVTVFNAPNVAITSTTQAVCLGSSVSFTGSGAVTYTWSVGSGVFTSSITDSPLATTIYTLSGTDAAGCINTAVTTVTVNSATVSVTGNTAICTGSSASLIASGATDYLWLNNSSNFAQLNITPTVTTIYTVNATNTDGVTNCTTSATYTLIVNPKPTVTASATKSVICKGESAVITAAGATTYSWTGGALSATAATSASIMVTPLIPSTVIYTVTGTDDNGCVNKGLFLLTTDACTGIREAAAADKNIVIFPNPNAGIFTVASKNVSATASIEIYNTLGTLVKKQVVDGESTVIDLKNEANGIYFINVIDNNKAVHTSKIVKQ